MSVFISNLDDFISPGQACVNPIALGKAAKDGEGKVKLGEAQTLEYDVPVEPLLKGEANLIKKRAPVGSTSSSSAKVATISLNDCLACSGCVTSAETVLIQHQSSDKLFSKLRDIESGASSDTVVVAMSPQSRASLASQLRLSSKEAFLRIATLLKRLGVKYVIDVAAAADIALIEAREEFMVRYRNSKAGSPVWEKPSTTIAHSSSRVKRLEEVSTSAAMEAEPVYVGPPTVPLTRPMIVSSCPGWVCYAEKTQPEALPLMSSVKSAQQILGCILKRYMHDNNRCKANEGKVFLVSVQPCFDKKLEASRLDFHHEDDESGAEVDLVLSTTELWDTLKTLAAEASVAGVQEEEEADPAQFLRTVPLDPPRGGDETEALFRCFSEDGARLVTAVENNRGSGGYLEYIYQYATNRLTVESSAGLERPTADAQGVLEVGRNADISTLTDPRSGLKFAKVYGFRNIQSLMLKLKRGKCDFDFVEVMACPAGCLNGGGQVRSAGKAVETPEEMRGRVSAVEECLQAIGDVIVRSPEQSPLARYLYCPERLGAPLSESAREALHTRFHAVPKLEELAPLASKW